MILLLKVLKRIKLQINKNKCYHMNLSHFKTNVKLCVYHEINYSMVLTRLIVNNEERE